MEAAQPQKARAHCREGTIRVRLLHQRGCSVPGRQMNAEVLVNQ